MGRARAPSAVTTVSVTIVTPTLNAAKYLPDCLRSVRDQNYPLLEHIFVDGGSIDATSELVGQSGAEWLSRPGLKQSAALNVGFQAARGEVVAWLNADDMLAPDALHVVDSEFSRSPELDVLMGDCVVVDALNRPLWTIRPGAYDFHRLLTKGNYIGQPAVFLRKPVFDDVGYLDERLDYGMDYDLWLRLARRTIKYTPRSLAKFRWHGESKTATNLDANWHELLRIVRHHGGGWTRELVWSYVRARLTLGRDHLRSRFAPAKY